VLPDLQAQRVLQAHQARLGQLVLQDQPGPLVQLDQQGVKVQQALKDLKEFKV